MSPTEATQTASFIVDIAIVCAIFAGYFFVYYKQYTFTRLPLALVCIGLFTVISGFLAGTFGPSAPFFILLAAAGGALIRFRRDKLTK
jgi:hypothetical protein